MTMYWREEAGELLPSSPTTPSLSPYPKCSSTPGHGVFNNATTDNDSANVVSSIAAPLRDLPPQLTTPSLTRLIEIDTLMPTMFLPLYVCGMDYGDLF